MEGLRADQKVDRKVGRLVGHSADQKVDRMEGRWAGHLEGHSVDQKVGDLEGLRADRLGDRLVGPMVGRREDHWAGRLGDRMAGHSEEVSQAVLALVYLEPAAWLVERLRFQPRVVLARKVASKGDPQMLARPQVLAKAEKEQATEA